MADERGTRVETAAEAAAAARSLVQGAERLLRIFTRDLDAPIYSSDAFCQAVSALARRDRHTGIRILIQDPTPAIRDGHRLIELVERLASHIGVRRVAADWADEPCAFLLTDERGLLWRPAGDRFDGRFDPHAGAHARKLRQWFDRVWEHSPPDPEFRRLSV